MSKNISFPPQQLSFNKKTKAWRKRVLDWADDKTYFNYSPVRSSLQHKKINYDLINGKLHMKDLQRVLNPDDLDAGFIPETIQHYPIMNSKLNVLRGEEIKRVFDYKVVITNPNAISEIETNKKSMLMQKLQQLIANEAQSEEEYQQELEKLNKYSLYEWQDLKEIRCNALLNHYWKEYNMPLIFNEGFMDAMTVGEELYQCDIVGGEPIIERLNPKKISIWRSGYSNRVEDADVIILDDYWSPGKVIDVYGEVLNSIPKAMKALEDMGESGTSDIDSMGNIEETKGFVNVHMLDDTFESSAISPSETFELFSNIETDSLMPYDTFGNVRVLRVYWKSRRKIKKVKSYDSITGEVIYTFYPETYVLNEALGEEEEIFYINEAWEGTKIGKDIYVNMRPRPIQYNRQSNPSRCHFGIVGSIYSFNESKPFSLVDMMKPYNYLYDAIHDRLNKLISRNWGKIIQLDLAKVPKDWTIEKWLYFAKTNNIAVIDSFREGNIGAATGKLAGAMNNASSGVIDAEVGNVIQSNINLLEYIKNEMSEVAGITRQREGQISNRETVGGVERATLQSSHITEYLFTIHDDVKKRALECFLETAKIALKGRNKKFQYILPDTTLSIIDIDGDEFAEADYGLVVDNGRGTQDLNSKLDMLAQAALQNQALSFSAIMKLYNSSSLAEKQRLIEQNEQEMFERQQQAQQQQSQLAQQQMEANMLMEQNKLEVDLQKTTMDNETKLIIANIQAQSKLDSVPEDKGMTEDQRANLDEKIREFDARLKLDKERLELDKSKARTDAELKRKQINKQSNKTNK